MNELAERVKSVLSEQDRNFLHIHHALDKLTPYLPIGVLHLDDSDVVEHLDQMVFRFMKIQDGIGRRLIPLMVDVIEPDTSEMTFIDKLNKLEKFGLLEPGEWNGYRKIRNDVTHTYPEEKDALVDAINEAIAVIGRLETTYLKMQSFCREKLHVSG